MPIVAQGEINATALLVPDVYVQIVPPSNQLLNGVPTNVLGIVGTAQWGPTNIPVSISSMASYARQFGSVTLDGYDLGTAAVGSVSQGANNLRLVRVAKDDAAATGKIDHHVGNSTHGLLATSYYTGSLANKCQVTWGKGSSYTAAKPTYRVTVTMPGQMGEVFDNIAAGTSAGAAGVSETYANAVAAINLGQNSLRGPSKLIKASASASEGATVGTDTVVTLSGGLDGADLAGDASTHLVGAAGAKTGINALTDKGVSIGFVAGHSDSSDWAAFQTFAKQQGIYWICAAPSGEALATTSTNKKTAGIDSAHCKVMAGDWVYYKDTVNGQLRLVSPAGYVAGRMSNLSPEQSTLNKPLYGIAGTAKSYAGENYSSAEIQAFVEAGVDVIATPSPGGNYYSCRVGHNSSTNPVIQGDNYSRLTNYIAATLDKGLGSYIGRLQSAKTRRQAKSTLESFLANMERVGQIGNAQGSTPFQVVLDDTNNPASRVALGYLTADIRITYLSVIEKFIVNVEAGQSVEIIRATTESEPVSAGVAA